jgi:hypothetical protein
MGRLPDLSKLGDHPLSAGRLESMSDIGIFRQLSDFNADWSNRPGAMCKLMRIDRGLVWAHCCTHIVGSLYLVNLTFPS